MKQKNTNDLQVIIASGPEALDRAVLGFAFALSAAISGVKVTIILTCRAVVWAKRNIQAAKQSVNGFASIEDYLDMLEENNVVTQICSSCIDNNCALSGGKENPAAEISYVGMTEVAIKTANGTAQTVVF